MSSNFCQNCGEPSDGGKFCANCGKPMQQVAAAAPTQSQPTQSQPRQAPQYAPQAQFTPPQGGYAVPQGMMFHQKSDYQRPPDYKYTESMMERIIGTLKLDIHVVEEIEDRTDLEAESRMLIVANFTAFAIINLISIFTLTDFYEVDSVAGAVTRILLTTFVGGLSFIYMIALIGNAIGGHRTTTDTPEIIRVLAYGYIATTISQTFLLISSASENAFFDFLWFITALYSLIVFVFVVRRALDRGYGIAIITIVLSFIGRIIIEIVLIEIANSLFGGSYTFL